MHDIAGVSITIATILAASFFSNQSVNTLRTEMRAELNSLRSQMTARIDKLRSEMTDKMDSLRSEMTDKMDSLRSDMGGKLDSIQKDMRDLYAEQGRHDLRIATLEQNQK